MCQQYKSFCSRCNASWTTYSFPCCRYYCSGIQFVPDTPRLCNHHAHAVAIETQLKSDRLQRERDKVQATMATMYNNFQIASNSWANERNSFMAESRQAARDVQETQARAERAERAVAQAREQLRGSVNKEGNKKHLRRQLRRSFFGF